VFLRLHSPLFYHSLYPLNDCDCSGVVIWLITCSRCIYLMPFHLIGFMHILHRSTTIRLFTLFVIWTFCVLNDCWFYDAITIRLICWWRYVLRLFTFYSTFCCYLFWLFFHRPVILLSVAVIKFSSVIWPLRSIDLFHTGVSVPIPTLPFNSFVWCWCPIPYACSVNIRSPRYSIYVARYRSTCGGYYIVFPLLTFDTRYGDCSLIYNTVTDFVIYSMFPFAFVPFSTFHLFTWLDTLLAFDDATRCDAWRSRTGTTRDARTCVRYVFAARTFVTHEHAYVLPFSFCRFFLLFIRFRYYERCRTCARYRHRILFVAARALRGRSFSSSDQFVIRSHRLTRSGPDSLFAESLLDHQMDAFGLLPHSFHCWLPGTGGSSAIPDYRSITIRSRCIFVTDLIVNSEFNSYVRCRSFKYEHIYYDVHSVLPYSFNIRS